MIMIRTLRRDIARYNKEDEMVGFTVVVYLQLTVKTCINPPQAYTRAERYNKTET